MLEEITNDSIGLVIGSLGVLLAIISILRGQKLEKKLKEKDKLKTLSKKTSEYIPVINEIIEEIKTPEIYDDLFYQLQLLSQEIISKSFDENKDVFLVNTEIKIEKENDYEKLIIENKDSLIKCFKEDTCGNITIDCVLGNNSYYLTDYLFYNIKFLLKYIHDVENEFGDILIEFKPGMLGDLKNCLEVILEIVIDSSVNLNEIEINITSFNKTDEIGMWIYSQVIRTDELMPKLDELVKLKEEIEKFREILITTSYS